ncbi:hypothetical protein MSS93_10730 [Deinococcus radiodurans]|nr:hypothetical protein MSS93_10730 [Deinococcus radiodurans]
MTPDAARLSARPDPTLPPPGECGLLPLNLGSSRDGLLYVPEKHPLDGPRPCWSPVTARAARPVTLSGLSWTPPSVMG